MAKLEDRDNSLLVSTKELSETLGLSSRRIQQLAKEKIMVRVEHGKYDLPASIQTYIETIKEESKTNEEVDYNTEKTLLTRAQRKKAEMELKILQGDVHKSDDVERVMNDMLTSFRAQLLVLPGKVSPQIIGITELEVIKTIIKEAVHETLQELSEYEPNIFHGKDVAKVEDRSEEKSNKIKKKQKKPKKNG